MAEFPVSTNRYKFSGKESQTTGELGLLDFGARMYDAEIGRWWNMDPLADKYAGISPYAYCNNDPVRLIDIDGRDWGEAVKLAKEAVSGAVTFGLQGGVRGEIAGTGFGVTLNIASGDIARYEDGKFSSGDRVNAGMDLLYGPMGYSVEQYTKRTGPYIAERVTTNEFSLGALKSSSEKTETAYMHKDGTYIVNQKQTEEKGEAKYEFSMNAAAIIGVEFSVNIGKLIDALQEAFK